MYTTLTKIRSYSPCKEGWIKLLKSLNKTEADDEPLPLSKILDSNGLEDTIWCLRAVEHRDREIRILAVHFARQVSHLLQDHRSLQAIETAEAFAKGEASSADLQQAKKAACVAAAYSGDDAYTYAAYAAYAAYAVADADAADAADAAYAAYSAAVAADAAAAAAAADDQPAAAAAARQATQEAHEAHLRKLLCQPSH